MAGLLDDYDKRVDKRLTELTAGFEKRFSELPKPKEDPTPPKGDKGKEGEKPPESSATELELRKQLATQSKKLEEIEAQATAAKNKAILADLRGNLDRVSNGKLAPNAEGLIKKEFLSLANIDLKSESVTFNVSGKTFDDVGEAFDAWLGLDDHKGYRAAPAGTQVQTPVQPYVFTGSKTTQDDFSAELDKAGFEL